MLVAEVPLRCSNSVVGMQANIVVRSFTNEFGNGKRSSCSQDPCHQCTPDWRFENRPGGGGRAASPHTSEPAKLLQRGTGGVRLANSVRAASAPCLLRISRGPHRARALLS